MAAPWEEWEDAFILEVAGRMPRTEIAIKLERRKCDVSSRAVSLGVSLKLRPKWILEVEEDTGCTLQEFLESEAAKAMFNRKSVPELASELGIKYKTLQCWVLGYGIKWPRSCGEAFRRRMDGDKNPRAVMSLIDGIEDTIAGHCRRYDMAAPTVSWRMKQGMTLKQALTTPVQRRKGYRYG